VLLERSLYLGKGYPDWRHRAPGRHRALWHRSGEFGAEPGLQSAHELDNLYVTDASFFPSIGAVNPTLTIIANALRVADRIKSRLGT
jgi:choline dehydrogenase-like flavoprotein